MKCEAMGKGWRRDILPRDSPLVSIVTVVRNGEATLRRTIESVRAQTYGNIEYIVIDGVSTDGTAAIVEEYVDVIDCFLCESDKGIYDAMNKGIALTRGELVGIINADDWYEETTVETVVAEHLKDKKAVVYGLLAEHEDENLVFIGAHMPDALRELMIPHPTCFVPKAVYEEHGSFDLAFRLVADFDMMQRLYMCGTPFRFLPKVLAHFTRGGSCDSHPGRSAIEKLLVKKKNGLLDERAFAGKLRKLKIKSAILALRSGGNAWRLN